MDNNRKKLFEEFPPISIEQWEEVIKADLKGADYEKKLHWKTDEGILVKPYYTDKDVEQLKHTIFLPGEFPYVRGTKTDQNNWEIVQDILVYDISEANKTAIEALERGASGLSFILELFKQEINLDLLLKDIYIQCIDLSFDNYAEQTKITEKILYTFEKRNVDASKAKGSIGYNPLGNLTRLGNWYIAEEKDFSKAKELIILFKDKLPLYRILLADGRLIREAGSTIVQEMACTLAMGSEYLQKLTELGLSIDEITPRIQFNLSIGSNYFFEIAKIRAFRMLWAKVVEAYGAKNKEVARAYIHATTAFYNMTLYDPYVNMLRNTTESMSAVIAGVNSLSVRPFDAVYKMPNSFSNRISRNAQIILKEEAYFDKVVDPSAGSYYIETLTASLANEAWKEFLRIDGLGGYSKAFISGDIYEKVKNQAQKLFSDVAARKYTLLGTNQYPDFTEQMLSSIEKDVYYKANTVSNNTIARPLEAIRISTPIEQVRLKTELSGRRPKVFMLTIGNLAMRLARSQFSCNFFAVAGYEVIDNNGFSSIAEGVEAAFNKNADIIVLCSSDEEYANYAPEAFELINGKAIFVVAGNPPCMEELKAKGIENFISIRSNVLETLTYYQKLLGIN